VLWLVGAWHFAKRPFWRKPVSARSRVTGGAAAFAFPVIPIADPITNLVAGWTMNHAC